MTTDNYSEPPDRLPNSLTTAEQVTDPVGAKAWDTPLQGQDASPTPDQRKPDRPATAVVGTQAESRDGLEPVGGPDYRHGGAAESARRPSLGEYALLGLSVAKAAIPGFPGDIAPRTGPDYQASAYTQAAENRSAASQVCDEARVTDESPLNLAEVRASGKKGTDPPDEPVEPKAQLERERDHFDRPRNDPKPTYADIRDNRPTPRRQGQGRH